MSLFRDASVLNVDIRTPMPNTFDYATTFPLDVVVVQCPVCLQVPKGRVFTCHQGHHMCEMCYERMLQCPVGRCPLPEMRIRGRIVEDLIERSDYKFECDNEGCAEQLRKPELEPHLRRCGFEIIKCHMYKDFCTLHNARVARKDLFQHIVSEHRPFILEGGEWTMGLGPAEDITEGIHYTRMRWVNLGSDSMPFMAFWMQTTLGLQVTALADRTDPRFDSCGWKVIVSSPDGRTRVSYEGPFIDLAESPMAEALRRRCWSASYCQLGELSSKENVSKGYTANVTGTFELVKY